MQSGSLAFDEHELDSESLDINFTITCVCGPGFKGGVGQGAELWKFCPARASARRGAAAKKIREKMPHVSIFKCLLFLNVVLEKRVWQLCCQKCSRQQLGQVSRAAQRQEVFQ